MLSVVVRNVCGVLEASTGKCRFDKGDIMSENSGINFEQRIRLYELFLQKETHAGDGIWQRFNFLSTINLALFGAFGFMSLRESEYSEFSVMKTYVAVGGLILSLSTIASLIRLYRWRDFWHNVVKQWEESLSSDKAIDEILPYSQQAIPLPGIFRMSTLVRYTQVPMYLLTIGWCLLLIWIFRSG